MTATATAQAQHLIEAGNATPEAVHNAALACFEVGALDAAQGLLAYFEKHDGVQDSAWLARFQSWLDADDARKMLADPLVFAAQSPAGVLDLAKQLKNAAQFGLARRLLARLVGEREDLLAEGRAAEAGPVPERQVDIYKQLALCTYKDIDLQPARALDEAERLLMKIGLNDAACADPEILGQGGAVYKRRGELTGQFGHLLQSLAYYRKGWQATGQAGDKLDKDAYCAGNAAFMLDLLANKFGGADSQQAAAWRADAKDLRENVIALLEDRPDKKPWALASLADACFALGRYDEARQYYAEASGSMAGDWQRKTTFLQAVELARLQGITLPGPDEAHGEDESFIHPAWNALVPLLGKEKTRAALAGYGPKTGLALSGGGFRAAFFHLGVLARLADADLLRQIEVISTVSGGSIVGAHYFLKLKKLLEENGDDDISADDYRELVRELIGEFSKGVATNLRMRVFCSLKAILKSAWCLKYNLTLRLGELYDQTFYASKLGKTTTLRDLIVAPQGETRAFSPRQDNWLRRAKVPILQINATNLNSGHSWQFAGTFMGEPPGLLEAAIDGNARYARIHFDDPQTPKGWQNFPLGSAVAASSAVPGLFSPVPLYGYYPGRDVRLSDGGVYDNQGVDTLMQESCTLILCSDGSGQLDDSNAPSTRLTKVLGRASDISMERVRIVEYQDLRARQDGDSPGKLMFVHLRQGLDIERIPPASSSTSPTPKLDETTRYGIRKDMQRLLSRLRTDLDSFSEVEAQSLMLSGYLASQAQAEEIAKAQPNRQSAQASADNWTFGGMADYLCPSDSPPEKGSAEVKRQLEVSSKQFAKVLRLWVGDVMEKLPKWLVCVCMILLLISVANLLGGWIGIAIAVALIPPGFVLIMCFRHMALRIAETALAIAILPVALVGLILNADYLARGSRRRFEGSCNGQLTIEINNLKK